MAKLTGVDEALGLIKTHATAKFDESVEIAINLGVDPRHADQMVRGVVTLPAGTGKDVRVAVFARNEKAQAALDAGADIVGAEDLLESIQAGNIDFQRVIATPDMMGLVGRLGKGGQIEFRVEKAGIIHAGLGKSSFTAEDLRKNFDAFVDAIVKAKPTGSKGKYVRKIALSSSMGPGVKVDVAEVAERCNANERGQTPSPPVLLAAPALAGWECENQGVWPITLNVCFGRRKAQVL